MSEEQHGPGQKWPSLSSWAPGAPRGAWCPGLQYRGTQWSQTWNSLGLWYHQQGPPALVHETAHGRDPAWSSLTSECGLPVHQAMAVIAAAGVGKVVHMQKTKVRGPRAALGWEMPSASS